MEQIRVVLNSHACPASEPYGPSRATALSSEAIEAARTEIASWPGYAPTPLRALSGLARDLGLTALHYKDERGRFGLGSFKALGGAYAVMRVLVAELGRRGVAGLVTTADLTSGRYKDLTRTITITSATDGNHGRSVAWGARMFGAHSVIYIHETVSQARADAIAAYGAEVIRLPGGYDDSVRHAFMQAAKHGWFVVQDTATADYVEAPRDITAGYSVMAAEIMAQIGPPPTHVILPAGVGGQASAITAQFWISWGINRPKVIVLEPLRADCVYQSIANGRRTDVTGDLDTVMAGLSCGEVSTLAWEILAGGANAGLALDDAFALAGMRRFASPLLGDPAIVAGECSGGGLGALLALQARPDLRQKLGLEATSRVLLIGTEGDTDAGIYHHIVGKTAAEVLAS
jgi:diaminopropionate ammonia-lyase